jgi:hypothetical protein
MILGSVGVISSVSGIDPDAQTFITAAAITNVTQQGAINTLVVNLKGYNIWTKILIFYPFVGGTALSNSKNLKNPSFGTLTYTTGITHGPLGIQGNSISYADTGLKSTTIGISQNSAASGIYMQSWTLGQTMPYGHFGNLTMYRTGNVVYPMINNALNTSTGVPVLNGFLQTSRNSAPSFIFKDKNNASTTLVSGSQALNSTLNLYVCFGNNYNGVTDWISCNYYSVGLTDIDLTNMYTAVQEFQTTLGRQV